MTFEPNFPRYRLLIKAPLAARREMRDKTRARRKKKKGGSWQNSSILLFNSGEKTNEEGKGNKKKSQKLRMMWLAG
jgi:hypothetical protein